jgi:hypothetical protein
VHIKEAALELKCAQQQQAQHELACAVPGMHRARKELTSAGPSVVGPASASCSSSHTTTSTGNPPAAVYMQSMLCCVKLCCVLCHAVLCCAVSCCAVCSIMLCCVLRHAVLSPP